MTSLEYIIERNYLLGSSKEELLELARRNDVDAVLEKLLGILKNGTQTDKFWAVRALVGIGDERAIGPLIEAMEFVDDVTMIKLKEGLADMGGKASEMLLEQTRDSDPKKRENAIHVLGMENNPGATKRMVEIVNDLEETPKARLHAVWALKEYKDRETVGCLVAHIDEKEIGYAVIDALGEIGDASALEIVSGKLASSDVIVREKAVDAFAKLWGGKRTDLLAKVLEKSDAAETKIAVAKAAGKAGCFWMGERIGEMLCDKESKVRKAAAEALGALEDIASVGKLVLMLDDRGEERDVKEAAVKALASIGMSAPGELFEHVKDAKTNAGRKRMAEVFRQINEEASTKRNELGIVERDASGHEKEMKKMAFPERKGKGAKAQETLAVKL